FGEANGDPPSPYESRFRRACDIYNLGLEYALAGEAKPELALRDETRKLPVGSVDIQVDGSRLAYAYVTDFLAANEFVVPGWSVDHRNSGLGVPLIAVSHHDARSNDPRNKYLARAGDVPATAFLRPNGGIGDIEHGLSATLELYDGYATQVAHVGRVDVPLE